jgi:hypothetical protein
MGFPPAGAEIYYNEEGEPTGWDAAPSDDWTDDDNYEMSDAQREAQDDDDDDDDFDIRDFSDEDYDED